MKAVIAPSMLSSDFARLAEEAKRMEECGADWLHMDVMVFHKHFKNSHFSINLQDGFVVPKNFEFEYSFFFFIKKFRHFVTNLTIGAPVIKSLRKHTEKFLDCHLMVSNPSQWVDDFKKAGANGFTFHFEATGLQFF